LIDRNRRVFRVDGITCTSRWETTAAVRQLKPRSGKQNIFLIVISSETLVANTKTVRSGLVCQLRGRQNSF